MLLFQILTNSVQDQESGATDLQSLVEECLHSQLSSKGGGVFVGGAYRHVQGCEGHDLAEDHHVQRLSREFIGLISPVAVILPVKELEALPCAATPLLEKLIQQLVTGASFLPHR